MTISILFFLFLYMFLNVIILYFFHISHYCFFSSKIKVLVFNRYLNVYMYTPVTGAAVPDLTVFLLFYYDRS